MKAKRKEDTTIYRLAVLRRLSRCVAELEGMGANDMGHLTEQEAGDFHLIVEQLRLFHEGLRNHYEQTA